MGARPGVQGDGGHDPAPRGGVPGPWEQHWGVHLASGQHEEEGGGGGHDDGQPGLHQDQPSPSWLGEQRGDGPQRRQVTVVMYELDISEVKLVDHFFSFIVIAMRH